MYTVYYISMEKESGKRLILDTVTHLYILDLSVKNEFNYTQMRTITMSCNRMKSVDVVELSGY